MQHTKRSASQTRSTRPSSVTGPQASIRLPADLRQRVDDWARSQADRPSRAEAIRRLLARALAEDEPKLGTASISVSDLNASNDG